MELALDAADQGDMSARGPGTNRWVDDVLSSGYHRYRPTDTWSPAVDIYESRTDVYVVADLAGVLASGIDICSEGRCLTITGTRRSPQLPDGCTEVCAYAMEIDQGPFKRIVEIPSEVDVDGVEASFQRGLLWIRLPRIR